MRRFKHTFAERDPLTKLIQSAILTLEALDKIKQPRDPDPAVEFGGYCARSCAAYLYLVTHDERAALLAADPEVSLKRAKPKGYDDSHYWLVNSAGAILDLNLGGFDKAAAFPYEQGKGAGLRRDRSDPTKPALKDAQRIVAVVQAALDAADQNV